MRSPRQERPDISDGSVEGLRILNKGKLHSQVSMPQESIELLESQLHQRRRDLTMNMSEKVKKGSKQNAESNNLVPLLDMSVPDNNDFMRNRAQSAKCVQYHMETSNYPHQEFQSDFNYRHYNNQQYQQNNNAMHYSENNEFNSLNDIQMISYHEHNHKTLFESILMQKPSKLKKHL